MSEGYHKEALILGAMLHDIGKFVQRAQIESKIKDHCKWGLDWFDQNLAEKLSSIFSEEEKEIIRRAINTHHDHAKIITLSDSISAGMDRIGLDLKVEEEGNPLRQRLISIFSRVSISKKEKKDTYCALHPLSKTLQETLPVNEVNISGGEYAALLSGFNNELRMLQLKGMPPLYVIDRILFLLWKYTWCVPSAAYRDEPDISLFDHLKTSAAIAGCLFEYERYEKPQKLDLETAAFILLAGDLSGIQNFIFEVLTQQGKVAKRLRARSFYVQLLSEIASHKIIHQFHLPLCNILSSAGGNFLILLPALKETRDILEGLQHELESWLFERFRGEIYLSLASLPSTGKELKDFSEKVGLLKEKLRQKRLHPFKSCLIKDQKWQPEKFLFEGTVQGDERACRGCHKHPVEETNESPEEMLCMFCRSDIDLGKKLPSARYIAFAQNVHLPFQVFNYSFDVSQNFPVKSDYYLTQALNNPEDTRCGFKFLVGHIPDVKDVNCNIPEHEHMEHEVASFECIANASSGDRLIGYLKGDADNMGLIFRYGFEPDKPHGKCKIQNIKSSISRFCSLSRMFEMFFSGYLQNIITKNFPEIYTVFSGGDDFFFTGPWDKIIHFAKRVREAYQEFTGGNPDLTFSAAIIVTKPNEPVSFCTEEVSRELGRSKSNSLEKDRITLFSKTVQWFELDKILAEAELIINWLWEGVMPRAFVYNLCRYGEMAEKSNILNSARGVKTEYLKFVPLLTCDISRNLSKETQKNAFHWAQQLLLSTEKPSGGDVLPYLKTIMEYVLFYTRSKE